MPQLSPMWWMLFPYVLLFLISFMGSLIFVVDMEIKNGDVIVIEMGECLKW